MQRPLIAIGIELEWQVHHHYDVLKGILAYGREHDWNCRIVPRLESAVNIKSLPDRYDGVIARVTPALANACLAAGVPTVNVWQNSPDTLVPRVHLDHRATGRLAAQHLRDRGFHRLAFLGLKGDVTAATKFEAVRALAEDGICPALFLHGTSSADEWDAHDTQMENWLDGLQLPCGIVVSDDLNARYLINACEKKGILVPDQIAVVSCRYHELVCSNIEPTLTGIAPDLVAFGRAAAKALHELLTTGSVPALSLVTTTAVLIPGRSSDVYSVEDEVVARAMRFILDHAHHPISVTDAARAAGVGRRTLERRFRHARGHAVNVEISHTRLNIAKRLLETCDNTVRQVAAEAGFNTAARMAKVFRQHLGLSPSEYRSSLT